MPTTDTRPRTIIRPAYRIEPGDLVRMDGDDVTVTDVQRHYAREHVTLTTSYGAPRTVTFDAAVPVVLCPRMIDVLHARQAHPDYDYSMTFPHCADAHTSREGWERNPQADQRPHAFYPEMLGWRRLKGDELADVDPATRDPYAYPAGYDTVTDAHGA
jgi:hypothetical protein